MPSLFYWKIQRNKQQSLDLHMKYSAGNQPDLSRETLSKARQLKSHDMLQPGDQPISDCSGINK